MKRLTCVAFLALAFAVPAGYAQESGAAGPQKDGGQATEKAAKKGKEGQDCDTNRAGVRCSRPKPKKVWFWGKA
jgi:hypothetical protein